MGGYLISPCNCAKELLPTSANYGAFCKSSIVLLSHVLCNNRKLLDFKFDGIVQYHIDHKYSKEMTAKSDIVSVHA